MIGLLKADFYRVRKSKLTLVILILCVAFPLFITLMYLGINALTGDALGDETLFSANTLMDSAFSLTNNIGLVIPAFAGILVCSDISNGTLRNKVISGNRRVQIYLSHLIVSIVFCVFMIFLYTAATTGFALLFFPFESDPSKDMTKQILYWAVNGVMTFVYIATVSTFLAMSLRNVAPTIIFTLVLSLALTAVSSVVSFLDTEKFKYLVYLIPTYSSSSFGLSSLNLMALLGGGPTVSIDTVFLLGLLSFVIFGVLNTVLGIVFFCRKDIK